MAGAPDKIFQARKFLKDLDVPKPGQKPVAVGPAQMQTYSVPSGAAGFQFGNSDHRSKQNK